MRRGIAIGLGLVFMAFTYLAGGGLPADADTTEKVRWYSVGLASGETSGGYRWGVGAKGPKHEPLKEICAMAGMIEPPQPDRPYVVGTDGALCGDLRSPEEWMSETAAFGSGASRVSAFVAIYRPAVRKIVFVFDSGERKVYLPQVPRIPDRAKRGIPVFRFIADVFEGEPCVRRVTLFDGRGKVISRQAKPDCPGGEPLVPLSR